MKNIKLLILLLFELVLLNQLVCAQIRVIDNKGTVSTIDASKWVRIGTSNDIYAKYPGNVGIGTATPLATLHNAGSTILGMTTASDVTVAYTVPTTFVDNYSGVVITQKNVSPTITLPEPTNKTIGRLFTISNASTSTFPLTVYGSNYTIAPGQSGQLVWNGITWSLPGTFASSALSIAGDVSGTLGASSVDKLKGTALSISSLTSGDILKYDGTNWVNKTPDYLALSALSASTPLTYNSTTGAFGITQATTSTSGYLLSNDWNIFNNKQAAISLTTTGTSGNATFSGSTLNIPNYTYTLPNATGSTLGGVIVGSGLNVTAGTISTVNNGTVTNFSANDLSPLFTTTEATTTTTPALSFTLTNAGANTIFGNNTTSATAPAYFAATALPIAGDVSGTLGAVAVNKLKGAALSITSLAANNLLKYDGANWVNWAPNFLTLASLSATTPLMYNSGTGAFSISQATSSTDGYLSSAHWNTFNNKVSFPGFGLTTGKVWGYDAHPTTIAGYGLTDAAPISGSANYIQNQNSAAQSANMWISGSGLFNGSLTGNDVISKGNVGFHNDMYYTDKPNPIWSFWNSTGYGLAYYQGGALPNGVGDAIGFHFGSIVSPPFYVDHLGNVYSAGKFTGSGAGLTGTAPSLTAGSANFLNYNSMLTYGASGVNYFNLNGTAGNRPDNNDTPTAAWYHILRLNHANAAGYFVDIAANLNSSGTDVYHRLVQADSGTPVSTPWFKFIDSNNIGSQSVNYANRAEGATKLWSVTHPNDYWISNSWDGTYWQLTSNHSAAVNVGHASVATRLDGPAHTNGSDGWWRTAGDAGWYNETYATGIYSTEAGNVRTYNNASFIANNITATGQFNGNGAGLTGTAPNFTAGTANNLTNAATGIYASTTGTAYSAAVCVREASLLGAGDGTSAYAPRLGFHWGGRIASSISMESDGHFYFNSNSGTAREDIYTGKINADGAATNKVAYNAASLTSIDFLFSNIAYTSATATAITLSNIKDGGAYTLIFTSTAASGTVTFTASGVSFVYMGTAARTSGKTHIYSLIVAGAVAYVTMATSN